MGVIKYLLSVKWITDIKKAIFQDGRLVNYDTCHNQISSY